MSKYRSKKVEIDGMKFDSKAEAKLWQILKEQEERGEISDLRRQVPFELAPAVVIQGRKRPPLRYIADFVFLREGAEIIADCKGYLTDAYRMKRHLMKAVLGKDILEFRVK